jgi:vitamin B12 transporter
MAIRIRSLPQGHARLASVLAAAVFSFVFAVSSLFCEDSLDLGSVDVTASRISDPASDAPPALTVISAEDIAARGATTVAEALKAAPGLGLSARGPEGSQVAVTIRGSTANQVLVLVDGQRMNGALSGLVDLSRIPLDSVERIEVMRGGASSLYGGDALGGVVNIVTKKKSFPLSLSFENGSYLPSDRVAGFGLKKVEKAAGAASLVDSQKASLAWGPKFGDLALRLAGSATRADNAYTFIDSNYERRERQNAGLLAGDVSLGATLPLGPGSLSADLAGSYGQKGVPGTESSPTLNASETDTDASAALKYGAERFLSDILSLDASLRASYSAVDYVDGDDSSNDGHHKLYSIAGDVAQRAYATDGLTLAYGLSGAYAAAQSDSVGSPERLSGAAFAEAAIEAGALSLRPSLRYDCYSDFFAADPLGGIGAALGASYKLSGDESLKLNLSRAYRVPTFEDLYWPASAGVEGNPELKPETAYEANLGYERKAAALVYAATVYLRYSRDVILWQEGDDGIWRPSNYGAALYPGIEQELTARLGGGYKVAANYSFLYSYALSGDLTLADDKRLPMTPVHTLKGTLSYEDERFAWSTTAGYASLRYLKTANVAYLDAYFTLDLLVRWKVSHNFSAYAGADNLFDEQYAIVDGYPMPGTRIRLGLELKI